MARLPIVDSDSGDWGDVLNEYLQVAHNTDGTLKGSALPAGWIVYVDDYIPTSGITPGTTDVSSYVIAARDALLATRVSGIPSKPILQFGAKTYRIVSP